MTTVTKPWGHYEDIFRKENIVFKKIVILPGQSISYQKHSEREEFWFIDSGHGQFKWSAHEEPLLNYSIGEINAGDKISIPEGVAHQVTCLGNDSLVIFEVQFGRKAEESDIIRLDDKYGRN